MKGRSVCEACEKEFDWERYRGQTTARFCCKRCWYDHNSKKLSSFNDSRFKWNNSTDEEKLNRIKMRFEEQAIKTEGCWGWKGSFDKDGYPLLNSGANGKGFSERRGNRISWLIYKGKIPSGIKVLHNCDNPKCCNPDHLFLGTTQDNAQDMQRKGRATRGEKNPRHKLTEEDVKKIKHLLSIGVTGVRIAKDFSISNSRVSEIKKNKAWKYLS